MELLIEKFSSKGWGIAKLPQPYTRNAEVITAIPGDKVRVVLGKKQRGSYRCSLEEIITPSPLRQETRCAHAHECGGCVWQQMNYEAQLTVKQALVGKLFEGEAVEPIIASPHQWNYRNKMEFSFSQTREGVRFLGLMKAGMKQRVFNLNECHIAQPWVSEVVKEVRDWWESSPLAAYHTFTDQGSLRTLTLRHGMHTDQKMALLTVSGNPDFALKKNELDDLVKRLRGKVSSLFLRIQQIAKGTPTQFYEMHLDGEDHIIEELHIQDRLLRFKISPTSFFQPNTQAAQLLYAEALRLLPVSPEDMVIDLYCGTATLGLLFAQKVRRVIGIELNPHAVFDARVNAEINKIDNIEIICGDVGKMLTALKDENPKAVIVDPPRSGLDAVALQQLLSLKPKNILYISCNPKTQAENIKVLKENGYQLKKLQPIDQFPHTVHVENIALLELNG